MLSSRAVLRGVAPLRNALRTPAANSAVSRSIITRGYALSRFDKERPGWGRERRKVESQRRVEPKPDEPQAQEQQPINESDIWESSMRAPTSDPQQGLERLLMTSDRLLVTRQIEMLNLFIGFEQANKYVISNEQGETLGYIAEQGGGVLSTISRQVFRTHRPFRAVVMDAAGSPVLWLRRPFAFINSRMYVQRLKNFSEYTADGRPVLDTFGEVQQRWHLWRRRYDLFLRQDPRRILTLADEPQPEPEPDENTFTQLAHIDGGFWAWDFGLQDATGIPFARVDRKFRGFGRELFTDTGSYLVSFSGTRYLQDGGIDETEPYSLRNLNMEERALVLATAVNIDFDYFSRHSSEGGGFAPFLLLAALFE